MLSDPSMSQLSLKVGTRPLGTPTATWDWTDRSLRTALPFQAEVKDPAAAPFVMSLVSHPEYEPETPSRVATIDRVLTDKCYL